MTTIRYFVPEDGDSELQPNVFLAPKPRQQGVPPTLGEVKGAFPLPGRYHFRFKAPLIPGGDREKSAVAVWMDCVDERQPIPVWQNGIMAKVTRIGVEDEEDDDDDDSDFREHNRTAAANPPRANPAPVHAPPAADPMMDIFNGPTPLAAPHSAPPPNNLFDIPNPAPAAGASLLDMHTPSTGYSHAPAATDHDFFGMTAAPPTPQQPPYGANPYHQTPTAPHSGNNAFNSFSQQQGPFGGLGTPWKP